MNIILTGLFGKRSQEKSTKIRAKKQEFKKLVKEKKYDKVILLGNEILKETPHDFDVLFILGGIFYMRGKIKTALDYIDKALDIGAYDPDSLIIKANIHYKLGQFSKSQECCKKIQEFDSKNKDAQELLSKIESSSN